MDGDDCEQKYLVSGAVVYSHNTDTSKFYANSADCRMRFQAEEQGWKMMLRFEQLDIPDLTYNNLCTDALYVYDASDIYGPAVVSTCCRLASYTAIALT